MLAACGLVVESVEAFTRHRPLSALTDGVSSENVAGIHRVLGGLTDEQRMSLNLVDVNGRPHLNHWYVLIVGRKD